MFKDKYQSRKKRMIIIINMIIKENCHIRANKRNYSVSAMNVMKKKKL